MTNFTGTAGNDNLAGTGAADSLSGLGGNDILAGGNGDDVLDGGTGFDIVNYSDAQGPVTVNLHSATQTATGAGGNDTLKSIDGVLGSDYDDVLTGDDPYQVNATLVSQTQAGVAAIGMSGKAVMSPDGNYVLFSSTAANLVPGDTAGDPNNWLSGMDLFLKNLQTGEITQVNVDASNQRVSLDASAYYRLDTNYGFTSDGHSIYFSSWSFPEDHNLDPTQTIYRKSLSTGALTPLTSLTVGTPGMTNLDLSADGNTVYYNLYHQQGFYWQTDVFAHNATTGQTTLISTGDHGQIGELGVGPYSLSADGQWMAFLTSSSDLTPELTTTYSASVALKNLLTGETHTIVPGIKIGVHPFYSTSVQISSDGAKLLIVTEVPYLTTADASVDATMYIVDVATGTFTKLAAPIDNFAIEAFAPHFVGDTHQVAFVAYDKAAVGANGAALDLMVIDPNSGDVRTIAYDVQAYSGGLGGSISFSADGSRVALSPGLVGTADSLARGDTDGLTEVVWIDTRLPVETAGDDYLDGGAGSDTLSGLGGNDHLIGGTGHDTLDGGLGVDLLEGGGGNDIYVVNATHNNSGFGSDGKETIFDTSGEDTLRFIGSATIADVYTEVFGNDLYISIGQHYQQTPMTEYGVKIVDWVNNPLEHLVFAGDAAGQTRTGTAAADTLTGGAGSDMIDGGAGTDIMRGGAGSDTYYVDNAGDVVSEETVAGTDDGGRDDLVYASVSYTLAAHVESLRLTGVGNIDGTGNASDNFILGNNGNNVLTGGLGQDMLIGGAGNDTLNGGAGVDILRGGLGADHLDGGTGQDGAATSYSDGSQNIYDLADYSAATAGVTVYLDNGGTNSGEAAGDVFVNMEGIIGSSYNDILYGTSGTNVIRGGAGDDIIYGGANDGDGTGSLEQLYGGDGNDIIEGGPGNDTIDGGNGTDILSFRHATAGVTVSAWTNLNDINVDRTHEEWHDGYFSMEIVWGSDFSDHIEGSGQNLFGFAGSDILYSLGGNVTLDGGTGSDAMYGGFLGNDTFIVDNTGDLVFDYTGGGYDTVLSSISYTLTANIEALTLTGSAQAGAGNDLDNLIVGNGANNALYGAQGDDTLRGGIGADYLDGSSGVDTADYSTAATGVTVFLGGPQLNTGEAAGDTYTSIENLTGSAYADILGGLTGGKVDGGDGNDWIYGTTGAETLLGGNGNDVLEGRAGADALNGGDGADVASYRSSGVGIVLDMVNAANSTGDAAGDTLTNVENIWGSAYNDTIRSTITSGGQVYGFEGNDTLVGYTGNDVFYGGAGVDTMTGGAGGDDFFYLSWIDHVNAYGTPEPYEGGDTITDFTHGTDRIIVSRYWFGFGNIGGPAAALTSTHADFITSGGATSTRPTFFWNDVTKVLQFDPDGTGIGTAVTIATLTGATLTLSDIWTA